MVLRRSFKGDDVDESKKAEREGAGSEGGGVSVRVDFQKPQQ